MPDIIIYRETRIVTLDSESALAASCRPGDIALIPDGTGWWTAFVGEDGQVDRYDAPFNSHHEALCVAKAAAEIGGGED